MRKIDVHQVDAFTSRLFSGNPAGVVTNAELLTTGEMADIAREMNLSETAFVLPPTDNKANVRLRFFTPTDEVPFCGHATVSALSQLARIGQYDLDRSGKNDIRIETNIGILDMSVTNKDNTLSIAFTAPPVDMQAYRLQGQVFAEVCGLSTDSVAADEKIYIDRTLNYLYIPVVSLEKLGEMHFDAAHLRKEFSKEGIIVFCFYTNETVDPAASLHARGLAPIIGIDEDPFTGSMQAGLIHAAKLNQLIAADRQKVITEQGHFMKRPGSAEVSHDSKTGEILVTAETVPVFSTQMELEK